MARKKKRKNKKLNKICRIIAIILLLLSTLLVGAIIYLNILSTFYLVLVIIGVLLLDSGCLFLLFKSKIKIIGIFLAVILMGAYGLASYYIIKTTDFLSDLGLDYKTYNYSVIVAIDSEYEKIADISGETVGYYDDGSDETDKALDKLANKVSVEVSSYEDTHNLADDLLEGTVNVIMLEDSYIDILDENLSYDDGETFTEKIKIIYTFTVVVKTSDISKDIDVTEEAFNIYISGIDTYGEISSVSRSDVNMVVTVNPTTQQILLTSIPRDYYVALHGKTGYKDKLTHAGLYGIDMSIQTIEDLLDIEINYYVKVNFSSVIDIVNAIGGVSVYSDYDFTSIDGYSYEEGYNDVDGEEALSFARERKAFAIGDRQRVKNQQALLEAIFEKCTSKAIITKYSSLLDSLSGSFVTNMKTSRLTSLIKLQLSKNYSWDIITNSLNGSDGSEYTYSAPSTKAYVMIASESSVSYASELIQRVLDGEKLDKEEVEEEAAEANSVTSSGSSSSNGSTNSSDSSDTTQNNSSGLEVTLVRSSVSFYVGDEYIYYGYIAEYNGEDVTGSSGINEVFTVDGNSFANYRDLVSYVSGLESGSYMINYKISYKGDSVTLYQSVTIKEVTTSNSYSNDEEDTIYSDNEANSNVDTENSDEKNNSVDIENDDE